jgi:hypothetical protein
LDISVCAVLCAVAGALPARADCAGVVYVSSDFNHEVLRYNATTGQYVQTFVPVSSNGPLAEPHAILERASDVLVASFATDQVLRYDRESGNYLGVFIDSTSGLDNPVYMTYGGDGNLYISSQGSDEILRFTPAGVRIDAFVTGGSGGLDGPSGFAFGQDGRLYVAGRYSANVIAYDGATGAFDETLLTAADGLGAGTTFGLNFAANGDLYVASNNQVRRYHVATDTVTASVGLGFPIGIEIGPDGGIIVASSNNLFRIDPISNALSGPLLTGGTINLLNFFHFAARVPVPPADVNCDGVVDAADYGPFAACLTGPVAVGGCTLAPECAAAFDADGDCDVDLADFSVFAAYTTP